MKALFKNSNRIRSGSTTMLLVSALLLQSGCAPAQRSQTVASQAQIASGTKPGNPYYSHTDTTKLHVSNAEWKKILPKEVYAIGREGETEYAFTGKYWDQDLRGTYYCAVCGNELFESTAKFSSSCGWPSFFEARRPTAVRYLPDESYGMVRTEVRCGRCDSHLGHIFDDGPKPTGKRFCMNSAVLDFVPFEAGKTGMR